MQKYKITNMQNEEQRRAFYYNNNNAHYKKEINQKTNFVSACTRNQKLSISLSRIKKDFLLNLHMYACPRH